MSKNDRGCESVKESPLSEWCHHQCLIKYCVISATHQPQTKKRNNQQFDKNGPVNLSTEMRTLNSGNSILYLPFVFLQCVFSHTFYHVDVQLDSLIHSQIYTQIGHYLRLIMRLAAKNEIEPKESEMSVVRIKTAKNKSLLAVVQSIKVFRWNSLCASVLCVSFAFHLFPVLTKQAYISSCITVVSRSTYPNSHAFVHNHSSLHFSRSPLLTARSIFFVLLSQHFAFAFLFIYCLGIIVNG